VTIATCTINKFNKRPEHLLAWLGEARPDAVCLQELNAEDRAFPEHALTSAGHEAVWRGQRSRNGDWKRRRRWPVQH
jgi:exodeoxyribonuclease III